VAHNARERGAHVARCRVARGDDDGDDDGTEAGRHAVRRPRRLQQPAAQSPLVEQPLLQQVQPPQQHHQQHEQQAEREQAEREQAEQQEEQQLQQPRQEPEQEPEQEQAELPELPEQPMQPEQQAYELRPRPGRAEPPERPERPEALPQPPADTRHLHLPTTPPPLPPKGHLSQQDVDTKPPPNPELLPSAHFREFEWWLVKLIVDNKLSSKAVTRLLKGGGAKFALKLDGSLPSFASKKVQSQSQHVSPVGCGSHGHFNPDSRSHVRRGS
jgi:flagellar motor protein MotB